MSLAERAALYWKDAIAPGAAVAAVAGSQSQRGRAARKAPQPAPPRGKDRRLTPAGAGLLGGGATDWAYKMTGLGIRDHGKKLETRWQGHKTGRDANDYPAKLGYGPDTELNRSQYQRRVRDHNRAHNVHTNQRGRPKEFFRTYPKELPGWKWKRFLGTAMSGKRGAVGEAGIVAAGSYGASRLAQRHSDVKKMVQVTPTRMPRHGNVGKRLDTKDRSGAAMAGSGGVIAAGGLVAGGIPGVKEPNGDKVWEIRGRGRGKPLFPPSDPRMLKSRISPVNLRHNAKTLAPMPRAGILGFRTSIHNAFIDANKDKTHGDAYVRGMRSGKMEAEEKIVRGMRAARRATYPMLPAGAALSALGVRRMKHGQVRKDSSRQRKVYGTALGVGGTVAAAGQGVPMGLDRFTRKYSESAKEHVRAAQRLAPHYGGLKTQPAKINEFGVVKRPARETMYPEKSNRDLVTERAADRIKGGDEVKAKVGRHLGIAAQERHFAEVFDNTSRGIRRLRGPGLAVAAAGATGLAGEASSRRRQRHANVGKKLEVTAEQHISPARVVELGAGTAAAAWGIPRLATVNEMLARGKPGRAINTEVERALRQAEAVRSVFQHSTEPLGRYTGRGVGRLPEPLRTTLKRVPRSLRPATATLVGAILVSHAHPVRRTSYRAVPARSGW